MGFFYIKKSQAKARVKKGQKIYKTKYRGQSVYRIKKRKAKNQAFSWF